MSQISVDLLGEEGDELLGEHIIDLGDQHTVLHVLSGDIKRNVLAVDHAFSRIEQRGVVRGQKKKAEIEK